MVYQKKLDKYQKEHMIYTEGLGTLTIPRISTGIFVMDLLTGGGFPKGRISGVYGKKGCTKTTTVLRAAGNFLRQEKESVLFVETEGNFDANWMQWAANFVDQKDIDDERLLVLVPDYGEQGVNIIKDMASEPEVGLIVIDSIAMLIPTDEADSDSSDKFVGLQAKLISRLYRVLLPIMSHRKREGKSVSLFVVNQIRSNIQRTGGGFASPFTKTGCHLQDHLLSLDIRLYTTDTKKINGLPAKSVHEFNIEKNKLGLQRRSGKYVMNLVDFDGRTPVGSIEELGDILTYAKRSGVLVRDGNKWKLKDMARPTLSAVQEELISNPELLSEVKEDVLQRCYKDILLTTEDKGE